ncbi:MAG: 3-methyl-2-oxobutanoate hydroxymethyltransferase [bacterium]|nr:3-methyl-2-oxobutanoate hydroxymethyltransferase [bacterium]
MSRMTTTKLQEMKKASQKITMLTAYDYSMAKILDNCGVDVLLVGDSLSMVMLGNENILPVTMDEMVTFTKAVAKGTTKALVVADMPFLSYKVDLKDAVYNAGRFIKEAGAQAVKVEGGEHIAKTILSMIHADIPVMGHLGLTPQAIHQMGGYKIQGKTPPSAKELIKDAKILEEVGIFALILECIPYELAQEVAQAINIPTIGIGAGPYCDGQVLVIHDVLGLYDEIRPKFVRPYLDLKSIIAKAVNKYIADVRQGEFPTLEESY